MRVIIETNGEHTNVNLSNFQSATNKELRDTLIELETVKILLLKEHVKRVGWTNK